MTARLQAKRLSSVAAIITVCCGSLLVGSDVNAQSSGTHAAFTPGDSVVTAKDGVQIGIRDRSMISLPEGTAIRVTEIRGDWIGGYAMVNGEKQLGWVHLSEIRAGLPPPPSIPDVPDDAKDVEFWKQLGVKLQMDDRDRVQHLEVDAAKIKDEDLVHLAGLPHLLSLDLSGQPVTDVALKHVVACKGLQKLYLDGTAVTNDGLSQLQSLIALEVLAVAHTKVTGAGIQQIQGMINLRVLNLGHCAVENDDLRFIEKLAYLEVLALPNTKISDDGLTHLRPLSRLRVLNLSHTGVKGPGLDNLLGLTQLRMLHVRECNVDPAVISKLDSEISGLAIYD